MNARNIALLMIAAIFLVLMATPALADKYADTIAVFSKSEAVQPFFKNCYGYAVFPTVSKAGIGIGGGLWHGPGVPGG